MLINLEDEGEGEGEGSFWFDDPRLLSKIADMYKKASSETRRMLYKPPYGSRASTPDPLTSVHEHPMKDPSTLNTSNLADVQRDHSAGASELFNSRAGYLEVSQDFYQSLSDTNNLSKKILNPNEDNARFGPGDRLVSSPVLELLEQVNVSQHGSSTDNLVIEATPGNGELHQSERFANEQFETSTVNTGFVAEGLLNPLFVDEDDGSVSSSYADSVFSVESLVSAGTDLSRNSGFTADEIMTATKRLVAIFQDDAVLKPLYLHALADPAIGPAKLERNLRRLFKQCAHDLEKEAKDKLEILGARLVSHQARSLAKSIVSRFGGSESQSSPTRERAVESDDSSDDDGQETFDDTVFEDLVLFSTFLLESGAFRQLREKVERFASSKRPPITVETAIHIDTTEALSTLASEDEAPPTDSQGDEDLQATQVPIIDAERVLKLADSPFSNTDPAGVYQEIEPIRRRSRANSLDVIARPLIITYQPVRRNSTSIIESKKDFDVSNICSHDSQPRPGLPDSAITPEVKRDLSAEGVCSHVPQPPQVRRKMQLEWRCVSISLRAGSHD